MIQLPVVLTPTTPSHRNEYQSKELITSTCKPKRQLSDLCADEPSNEPTDELISEPIDKPSSRSKGVRGKGVRGRGKGKGKGEKIVLKRIRFLFLHDEYF